ncbi:MAG: aryl-sulfate sulfotransferase [Planctomycetaceae bacterium]|nr:aryl-sulfate sulfotransferase [Planctomycetaceae bacterium]
MFQLKTTDARSRHARSGTAFIRGLFCLLNCVSLPALMWAQETPELPRLGVLRTSDVVCDGYTLISPLSSHSTFLINNEGQVVHEWKCDRKPGQATYLLEDGSLLRAGKADEFFQFPVTTGSGGRIQKYDWDGNLVWDFVSCSPYRMSHHDIEPLPNGNVLCIVWESYLRDVAIEAGRNPELLMGDVLWLEAIFELKPTGPSGAEIVWRWSLLDHLVQDWDDSKNNYGDPAEHPELVDINYVPRPVADWVHMNSIDYNAELDQIVVGSRSFSEVWVIDHSTTTEEAKGHVGGQRGRGGDLLYRWGNPMAWRKGMPDDRMLYNQHDAHWVPAGLPGAGHLLLFNNGQENTEQDFSSADEIRLPLNSTGTYDRNGDDPFGPSELEWTFEDPGKLFSPRISGVQRLPNGNTLICSGTQYLLLEVTPDAKVAWMYRNPPRFRSPTAEEEPETNFPPGSLPRPSLSDLPEEQLAKIRIPGGIPLEEGGTMFRATKYPLDYPAFRNRDLTVKLQQTRPSDSQ